MSERRRQHRQRKIADTRRAVSAREAAIDFAILMLIFAAAIAIVYLIG